MIRKGYRYLLTAVIAASAAALLTFAARNDFGLGRNMEIIQKLEMFFPGSPELCMVMTPANRPPIMLLRIETVKVQWALAAL